MNNNPEAVKNKLDSILQDMADNRWLFVKNPASDFSRDTVGKLSFIDTIKLLMTMGKGTTSDELIDYFKMDADQIPTQSALIQRRNQIDLSAFEFLFSEFATAFPQISFKFKNHCILAADGTHIVYATNENIIQDYNEPRLADHKGYNHMHLNAFVDVVSKSILDVVIQPGQEPDERSALHTMLDHFNPDQPEKYILTADRGYESYDLIFHCMLKHIPFVFRVKDPSAGKCILAHYMKELPDDQEEFDHEIRRFFTCDYNNIMKEQTYVYQYMNPSKNIPHFKPLLGSRKLVYVSFRVLKLKMSENAYEYIITNLPFPFDLEDIRTVYHYRWGCEVAFRYLKHAAGMLYFHSRKPEFLKQEIYATLTMYNFGVFLANEAADTCQKKKRNPENKYQYTIDFSTALRTARKYFLVDDDVKSIDIIRLLCKFVHAVKEKFRHFNRPLRGIGAIRFSYR